MTPEEEQAIVALCTGDLSWDFHEAYRNRKDDDFQKALEALLLAKEGLLKTLVKGLKAYASET